MVNVVRSPTGAVNDGEIAVFDGVGDLVKSSGAKPIAFAEGGFDPTVAFTTLGDLSVVYTRQYGRFQRVGKRVHVSVYLTFTPTYTSSSGEIFVKGLPYTAEVATGVAGWPLGKASANNVDYQSGNLDLAFRVPSGSDDIQVRFNVDAASNVPATVSHFPSGVQYTLTIEGHYPID